MRTNEKKGISLIVLIISIIVMIILATAIILSLSNSGIIGKANKAKQDSDTANLKEYVNVLVAEWELQSEETESYSSKEAYVNTKLSEKGYKRRLNEDGILLMENTVEAIDAGIKIGDVVTGYTLDDSTAKKSYPTSGNENTAKLKSGSTYEYEEVGDQAQIITRIEYTTWKYIGISDDGEILIAPDMVPSVTENQKITLSGKGGYLNGPDELDDMCEAMYSTSKGTARSMNIDDITRILDYTGEKGRYINFEKKEVLTAETMKIGDIEKSVSSRLLWRGTPEINKNLEDYYSNSYKISKEYSNILESLNTGNDEELARKTTLKNFVYTSNTYWLASSCVTANFYYSTVAFIIRAVDSESTFSVDQTVSNNKPVRSFAYIARPVVSLESNIQLTKVSDGNWSI